MSYWFSVMKELDGQKYPEQMAYLMENHGFSRAHANALVLYSRGNTSSQRFTTLDQYLKEFDAPKKAKAKEIFKVITDKYVKAKVVIAWNKPMVKYGEDYIFGLTVHKNHLLLAPWSTDVLEEFLERLEDYEVQKKTFKVPLDWKVDKKLLLDMVKMRIAELKE